MPPAAAHLLTRTTHRNRDVGELTFLDDLPMPKARVHELCGTARRTLALLIARQTQGPIFWIRPRWTPEHLHGAALAPWIDPGRFIYFSPRQPDDMLWSIEEALRAGAVDLVVGDLPGIPGLTAVRRMHLAAETGAAEGRTVPVGLLLTPGPGTAPGIETRWKFMPTHGAEGRTAWRLDRLRARTLPPASWEVRPGGEGRLVKTRMTVPDSA